jgi:hypothetical protein
VERLYTRLKIDDPTLPDARKLVRSAVRRQKRRVEAQAAVDGEGNGGQTQDDIGLDVGEEPEETETVGAASK